MTKHNHETEPTGEPARDNSRDDSRELLSVIVEPLSGYNDEEVISAIEETGASDIMLLVPGFISARMDAFTVEALKEIAYVHPKQKQKLR